MQWNEQVAKRISLFVERVSTYQNERLNSLAQDLKGISENELGKSKYQDIPIVYCQNDVAPKNILVDRGGRETLFSLPNNIHQSAMKSPEW